MNRRYGLVLLFDPLVYPNFLAPSTSGVVCHARQS